MLRDACVWVVEDDDALRTALTWLLKSVGHNVEAYSTPSEFLDSYDANRQGALVVDLQLPEMSGLELVRKLRQENCLPPFIVISAHGSITSAVEFMQEGAIDFMEKPFEQSRLLECVETALQQSFQLREHRLEQAKVIECINSLTPRERVVMDMVAKGMLTKQIANQLGISDKTVEVHRSHVTKKMHVRSVAQLVRLVVSHTAATVTC